MTDEVDETPPSSGPRFTTIRASSARQQSIRLDAKYYQDEFTLAKARVLQCGLPTIRVREIAGAFVPGRIKLITVSSPTAGAPYLKAHEAFKTLPESDRYVAAGRVQDYRTYLLREGMILTPSSGRNLGPTAYVGRTMSRFAMTDIMRIVPHDPMAGLYLLAYLRTSVGQALIRRGRTGTSIDHLAPADVLDLVVVWPDEQIRASIGSEIDLALGLLESARETIEHVDHDLKSSGRFANVDTFNGMHHFEMPRSSLSLRLDSAFYDDRVSTARDALGASGSSRLDAIADLRMLGRYKRYYVDRTHGRPILSGTQLLQLFPVNLKSISDRSFDEPASFVLTKGWSLLTCDGRAEEGLGSPAFVSSMWDGWMASNHVMRLVPKCGMPSGYLYAALRLPQVQLQIRAAATGSVIDALDPKALGNVLIPRLSPPQEEALGKRVERAWEQLAESVRKNDSAVAALERLLLAAYENARMAA